MKIAVLTNDNFFSFVVLRQFLEKRQDDVVLVVFSAALIGKRGGLASIKWSLDHTGVRHTAFKLMIYGVFRGMRMVCRCLPFIPNQYSSYLWIRRRSVPYMVAPDVNADEVVNRLRSANPHLIVSVSMNQIIKKEILNLPSKRCINVHCAPLPRYGGMSPYVWILAHQEKHSAATIHYMDEGLDTGDIIAQEFEPVVEKDSAFALFYRCCLRAAAMLLEVTDAIESERVASHTQDLSQKSYFSWPTRECIRDLRNHGYRLAKFSDIVMAIVQQKPRV